MDNFCRPRHAVAFVIRRYRANHSLVNEYIAMVAMNCVYISEAEEFSSTGGLTGCQVN